MSPTSQRIVEVWRKARPLGKPSRLASWLFLSLTAVALGWDVFLATDPTTGNTWSEVIRATSRHVPLLPWLFGAAALNLVQREKLPFGWDGDLCGVLMVLLTAFVALLSALPWELPPIGIAAFAGSGMLASHFLWPGVRSSPSNRDQDS